MCSLLWALDRTRSSHAKLNTKFMSLGEAPSSLSVSAPRSIEEFKWFRWYNARKLKRILITPSQQKEKLVCEVSRKCLTLFL